MIVRKTLRHHLSSEAMGNLKHRFRFLLMLAGILVITGLTWASTFRSFYGEAVYSGEFGFSSYAKYTLGNRQGSNDQYLFASTESSNTSGSQQPFSYGSSGVKAGVGMRHWMMNNSMFVSAEVYQTLFGTNAGDLDVKVGGAGFWGSQKGSMFRETYAELFYTGSSEVVSLNAIHRYGHTSTLDNMRDKIDIYGIGQLSFASDGAEGMNGSGNNRVELGAGMRYKLGTNFAISAELRGGLYLDPGPEKDAGFVNPVIMATGSF